MLQRQAVQLLRAGEIRPAIQAFAELVAIRPSPVADDWFNLAYLLRCDRQFESALVHYDRALALGITGPEDVQVNRAAILSEHLHRQDDAIEALEAALGHNPAYLPALLNLATIYEDCGRAEDARIAYRRVLEIDPLNGRAHGRLTAIDLHQGQAKDALHRLRTAMATSRIRTEDLAEFHFAMGLTLDAVQHFDEAFQQFDRGNRLARQQIPVSMRYDHAAMDQLIDNLISSFQSPTRTELSAHNSAGTPSPIFICGLFRSGSTLTERLIGRHPLVTSGGELEAIPAMINQLPSYPQTILSMGHDQKKQLRDQYLRDISLTLPSAGVFTDKRPDNFLHIGFLKQIFPHAKIVHTHRHPFDNILSIFFLYFSEGVSYGFDLSDIVHYLKCHDRIMKHWHELFGDDIIELDYDALVRDPDTVMQSALKALDLPWNPSCASTVSDNLAVKTASSWHVRKPLTDRSSGRWRNYTNHLDTVRRALALT